MELVVTTARISILFVLLCIGHVAARRCPRAQTTLATFNTALVPFYPGLTGEPLIEERTSLLIQQIQNSDADILCLQEVFFADIQRQLYQSLIQTYPYIHSNVDFTAQFDMQTPACTPDELQQFGGCVQTQCPSTDRGFLLGCIPASCGALQRNFSQQCADCISTYLPTLGGIGPCAVEPADRYQTAYGLMLLSRKELKDTQVSGFNPQSQFRGYLQATVDDVGTIICTHMTGILSTAAYGGPPVPLQYSNYDEQHHDEILTLFNQISNVDAPIVMGDFNHGPVSRQENIVYELPFGYGLMTARGFVSPYVLLDGRCTYCADSVPVILSGFTTNLMIDHVYLLADSYKGRVISSERFFDDVTTATGVPLSDHFGVKVTLKDIRSNCRWWEAKLYYCPAPPSSPSFILPALEPSLERLCVSTE